MRPVWLSAAGLAVLAGAVVAQPAPDAIGRDEAMVLAGACFGCHGPEGAGAEPIPRISGLPMAAMIASFAAFKAGEVPGATIMDRIAVAYDDRQITALARYFAGGWLP
jgi:sulfide dehydrogenase cytochrome subunit